MKLLDLFCGAGGAGMGYSRAGFEVVGVDIAPQKNYPFRFIQADALEFVQVHGNKFDVIHASPPCQFFTQMRASWRAQGVNDGYVDWLTPTLALLRSCGKPYVVENVVGAGKYMRATIALHGGMFGLAVHRSRLFESNVLLMAQYAPINREPVGVYDNRPRGTTHFRTRLNRNGKGRSPMRIARTLEEGQEAMGVNWMEWHELKEAIPPAYTQYIGEQLMWHLEEAA